MPTSVFPDGDYGHGVTPFDANDVTLWRRTFAVSGPEVQRMAVAAMTGSPETREKEIRANLTEPPPPAYSGLVKVSPTIDDILSTGPTGQPGHLRDRAPTDFGSVAGIESSSLPSLNAS